MQTACWRHVTPLGRSSGWIALTCVPSQTRTRAVIMGDWDVPIRPLTTDEESLWRSFIRVVITMPRVLEDDLERKGGLSLTEYSVLMVLSEAPDRELRMNDIANRAALSASRITRVVADLEQDGLVTKRRSSGDGRGNVAALTDDGLTKLRATWPDHLAGVRGRFMDHLSNDEVSVFAPIFERVAKALDDNVLAAPKPGASKRRARATPVSKKSAR
jgi:DNA-binding MarR family transcriptional regulator